MLRWFSLGLNVVGQAVLPAVAASVFTVPLNIQYVPVIVDGRTVSHKAAYFGTIFVGHPEPQNFTVVFDTGSGHLLLPSDSCQNKSCLQHRRYHRSTSGSAVDINDYISPNAKRDNLKRDQVSIAYGTGGIVGEFVQDIVCLGFPERSPHSNATNAMTSHVLLPHCIDVRIVVAKEMTSEPFHTFAFDGVLGLGLDSLSLDPEFNLFGKMTAGSNLDPVFSVFLGRHEGVQSQITFGGYDEGRMSGPFQWSHVASAELGYWRIHIHNVQIGNHSLSICADGGCYAILDTGTSMLGVPRQGVQILLGATTRKVVGQVPEDCRQTPGPPLIFDLGEFSIRLEAEDYFRPAASQLQGNTANSSYAICRASMLPVEMPELGPKVFLFGEPVLRKYYTAYDSRARKVGFAPAVQPSSSFASGHEQDGSSGKIVV